MYMMSPEEFLRERIIENIAYWGYNSGEDDATKKSYEFQLFVLDWHKNWPTLVEKPMDFETLGYEPNSDRFRMSVTQEYAFVTQEEFRQRFGTWPPTAPLIRAMLEQYKSHPDYNPGW